MSYSSSSSTISTKSTTTAPTSVKKEESKSETPKKNSTTSAYTTTSPIIKKICDELIAKPELKETLIITLADHLGEHAHKKLNQAETKVLQNLIETELINKALKLK